MTDLSGRGIISSILSRAFSQYPSLFVLLNNIIRFTVKMFSVILFGHFLLLQDFFFNEYTSTFLRRTRRRDDEFKWE